MIVNKSGFVCGRGGGGSHKSQEQLLTSFMDGPLLLKQKGGVVRNELHSPLAIYNRSIVFQHQR